MAAADKTCQPYHGCSNKLRVVLTLVLLISQENLLAFPLKLTSALNLKGLGLAPSDDKESTALDFSHVPTNTHR